jgi:hypothetical protein
VKYVATTSCSAGVVVAGGRLVVGVEVDPGAEVVTLVEEGLVVAGDVVDVAEVDALSPQPPMSNTAHTMIAARRTREAIVLPFPSP